VTRLITLAAIGFIATGLAAPVSAQSARAIGIVRDTDNKPIKGATIRATNPDAIPSQVVSTSDDRGRWAMIGLRTGTWTFTVEAPGFVTAEAPAGVRVAATPPMTFTLARDPGPIPGALPTNIQAQLSAAQMMRDQGRLDQAITAYRDIRNKNPKLTTLNLVIGDTYRKKAAQESDPTTRRSALELAIESYTEALKADAANERARTELESARAEAAALPR
jgi:tetratricopeptide (TPR) repeat protein